MRFKQSTIGNLGKDPEIQILEEGIAVTKFSLATMSLTPTIQARR